MLTHTGQSAYRIADTWRVTPNIIRPPDSAICECAILSGGGSGGGSTTFRRLRSACGTRNATRAPANGSSPTRRAAILAATRFTRPFAPPRFTRLDPLFTRPAFTRVALNSSLATSHLCQCCIPLRIPVVRQTADSRRISRGLRFVRSAKQTNVQIGTRNKFGPRSFLI